MNTRNRSHSPWIRVAVVAGVVLALALALGACSSSGSSKSDSGGAAAISIKDFAFTATTPVKAGATVTVHNNGPSTHTVTSDDGSSFNVSVDPGKDATFTAPSKPGTYKFHCSIHTQMTSSLTVT